MELVSQDEGPDIGSSELTGCGFFIAYLWR
jgi:hypothetical protein